VASVPGRIQEGVAEAKEKQVLNRVLAQVMIDPKDCLLVEVAQ
jgi:hypothetical protein